MFDTQRFTAGWMTGTPVTMAPAGFSPATVLYIEDNVANVQVIKTVIARLRPQWCFLSAQDGKGGLQQAREHLPDVILLDLQLPGMSGDLVLAELRADRNICQIPVFLRSADATMHSRRRLLALGATDDLSKPFNVTGKYPEEYFACTLSPGDQAEPPRVDSTVSTSHQAEENPIDAGVNSQSRVGSTANARKK